MDYLQRHRRTPNQRGRLKSTLSGSQKLRFNFYRRQFHGSYVVCQVPTPHAILRLSSPPQIIDQDISKKDLRFYSSTCRLENWLSWRLVNIRHVRRLLALVNAQGFDQRRLCMISFGMQRVDVLWTKITNCWWFSVNYLMQTYTPVYKGYTAGTILGAA